MAYLISTTCNYHWIEKISASTHGNGCLNLTLHGHQQLNEVELYIFTEDADLVDRLIEAINGAAQVTSKVTEAA